MVREQVRRTRRTRARCSSRGRCGRCGRSACGRRRASSSSRAALRHRGRTRRIAAKRVGVGPERRGEPRRPDRVVGPSTSRADSTYVARPPGGVEARRAPTRATRRAPRRRRSGSTRIEFGPQNGVWVKYDDDAGRDARRAPSPARARAGSPAPAPCRPSAACAITASANAWFTATYASHATENGSSNVGVADQVEEAVEEEPQHLVRDDLVVEPVHVRGRARRRCTSVPSVGCSAPWSTARSPSLERGRDAARRRRACRWTWRAACSVPARPPGPRLAAIAPSSSTENRNGPRCETTITRAQLGEEPQPVFELAGREEVVAHVLASLRAERVGADGIGEQVDGALRALLDRVDEVAVVAVADLQLDAAGAPADDRPSLPERLAHGEAEALAQRLLQRRRWRCAGTR